MYCPICSANVAPNQKFCRTCGFGLAKISESINEQLPGVRDVNLQDRKNRFERLGVIALSIFGLGVGSFFLYMLVSKIILLFSQGKTLAAIAMAGLVIVLACGMLAVILFAKAKEVQEESGNRRPQQPEELPSAQKTANLSPSHEPTSVASVTERTTDLLLSRGRREED